MVVGGAVASLRLGEEMDGEEEEGAGTLPRVVGARATSKLVRDESTCALAMLDQLHVR